jgi:hypothetical protein
MALALRNQLKIGTGLTAGMSPLQSAVPTSLPIPANSAMASVPKNRTRLHSAGHDDHQQRDRTRASNGEVKGSSRNRESRPLSAWNRIRNGMMVWVMNDLDALMVQLKDLEAALRTAKTDVYAAACAPAVAIAASKYFGMRRADRPGRDQRIYRCGAAIEIAGADHLDDYFLVGVLAAPEAPVWLCSEFINMARVLCDSASISLAQLLEAVFIDNAKRRYLIHFGAWRRHHWSQTIYRAAVEEFETSAAAEGGRWVGRRPTERQLYAIEQIGRTLAVVDADFRPPQLGTRGEAHDWIADQGGNPRFGTDTTPPRFKDFL